MTKQQIDFVRDCIANREMHAFYTWTPWEKVRLDALKLDKFECQHCKAKGKYTKATTVHHVNHVKQHPELALSLWYEDREGKRRRNLVSLCHDCHEKEHSYRKKNEKNLFTAEWTEDPPSK